jgi:hypothetical protein
LGLSNRRRAVQQIGFVSSGGVVCSCIRLIKAAVELAKGPNPTAAADNPEQECQSPRKETLRRWRCEYQQENSRPILDELEPWLRTKLGLISEKTKLAEAIRYTLSRWEGLTRFLGDGRIEIDSNVVERSIRPIALNCKNALFAGSDGGGQHWAIIASLIETCKLCDVDPQTYLADVLAKIVNGHSNSQIDNLLPWAYLAVPDLKAVA